MAELGNRVRAKFRRILSKSGSKKKMEMTLASDFHLINFKCEGPSRKSPHYKVNRRPVLDEVSPDKDELNQLLIRHGRTTQLLHIGPKKYQEIMTNVDHHIKNDLHWSPLGSYFVTLIGDLAILSGFKDLGLYHMLSYYRHTEVKLVDFSPGEKYLVTYNQPKHKHRARAIPRVTYTDFSEPSHVPEPTMPSELQIFDVRNGSHMMGAYDSGVAHVSWPVIRWAGGKDDRYFATLGKNTISIYETDTFNLLGEKPMEVEDVVDMLWSPTESIFALLKGCGKQPPKVALVEIPGMVELKDMELPNDVNPANCKMYWQSNGEYLAVVSERCVFILSCIKEKERDIHVEVDEKIHAFAWEPSCGHRFAMIIHRGQLMPHVSFYSMETGKVSKLATFKGKKADTLFWSPRGKHIVLAGLNGSFNGNLEFFDVDKLKTMNKGEHPKATVVAWDPTGRYVATAYTITPEMEKGFKIGFDLHSFEKTSSSTSTNGFNIWSWNGEKVYWKSTPKEYPLLQLTWRPYGGSIDDKMILDNEKYMEEIFMEKMGVESDDEMMTY